jgi:hypothetical protein
MKIMKKKFIQAEVSEEIHRRFENHPLHRGRNQRPFAGEVLEKWLETPEAQIPIMKEEVRILYQRLDWMNRKLESTSKLEARLQALEQKMASLSPISQAAS